MRTASHRERDRVARVQLAPVFHLRRVPDGFAGGGGERNSFPSPDGSLTAIVKEIHRAGIEGMGESAVVIRKPGGVVLLRQAYVSKDGEHGYDVARAEWTADSGYFLYVTQSSAGISPGTLPRTSGAGLTTSSMASRTASRQSPTHPFS